MVFVPQPGAVTATKSAASTGNNCGSTSAKYRDRLGWPSARNSNSTGRLPTDGERRPASVEITGATLIRLLNRCQQMEHNATLFYATVGNRFVAELIHNPTSPVVASTTAARLYRRF